MADPLSVAASIVGILAATAKVIEIVGPFVSASKDAPKIAKTVYSEVNRVRIVLEPLKELLQVVSDPSSPAASYASFIRVDHLVVVFTDGVLLFAELEALIKPLKPSPDAQLQLRQRFLWASKRNAISDVVKRMQNFLTLLSALLNVLQCRSDLAALRSQSVLDDQISRMLNADSALASRLATLEDAFNAIPVAGKRSVIQRQADNSSVTTTIRRYPLGDQLSYSVTNNDRFSVNTVKSRTTTLSTVHFIKDLSRSRVYRRAIRAESLMSYSTSGIGSKAMSVFEGLSITEVSAISVIALPLWSSDISNFMHYKFDRVSAPTMNVQPELPQPDSYQKLDLIMKKSYPSCYVSSLFYESMRLTHHLSSVPELRTIMKTYISGSSHGTVAILKAIKDPMFLHTLYYLIHPTGPQDYISFDSILSLVEDRLEDMGFSKRESKAVRFIRSYENLSSARPMIRMMNHLVELFPTILRSTVPFNEKAKVMRDDSRIIAPTNLVQTFLAQERKYVNMLEEVLDLREALSMSDEFKWIAIDLDPFATILPISTKILHDLENNKHLEYVEYILISKLADAMNAGIRWPLGYFRTYYFSMARFDKLRDYIVGHHPSLRHMVQTQESLFGYLTCHINRRMVYLTYLRFYKDTPLFGEPYEDPSMIRKTYYAVNEEWVEQLRMFGLNFWMKRAMEVERLGDLDMLTWNMVKSCGHSGMLRVGLEPPHISDAREVPVRLKLTVSG